MRLSTTSYLVLGMIALRGPSTPYDLKRSVSRSVGYFWHFPHAQLYSEPDRLAEAGLLALDTEDTGRRRKTYSLTGPGRTALQEWLAAPTPQHFEMRDVAELKLFFNEAGSPGDVDKLAREQIRQHEERIAVYEAMVERHGGDEWAEPRMITLELGLEMEHSALRFWSALADGDLDRLRRERAERDPRRRP
ncbi:MULTISPECIES: PadR family transcriptional regulator [Pseudonocardia]|uniref:Transcriptional regulator PadR-like family protein n=2 Tax=Pseudonocardia TaxID=1847 RepID=A0A1Y2MPJ7_PSEAH|nr:MULTISPECIES: PadR family transcriptional regulator [Pseudonocardia]OSY37160.1 Transcriptional regulator PadR-like family protein [Pseudonocardia autotrophica]TDN74781.1 PadR family transcriptional regulator [Pseudonocardia autotrophica]BBG05556.1 transcriptional regulator [Pseudonocardia autotrophica]GEC25807.1 transcriptional regulator [Pseudonocardia saturnea]